MPSAHDRDAQYRAWLTKAPLGLVLTGLGASLISEAGIAKARGAGTLRWVAAGTLALTVFNSGLAVMANAAKHRSHYERLRDQPPVPSHDERRSLTSEDTSSIQSIV